MATDGQSDYRGECVYTNTYSSVQPWTPTYLDAAQSVVPPTYDPRPLDTVQLQPFEPIGRCCAMTYDASGKTIISGPQVSSKPVANNTRELRLPTYDAVGRICAMTYDSSGRGIVSPPVETPKAIAYNTEALPFKSYEPKGQICAMTYDSSGLGIVTIEREGANSK